MVIDQFIFHSEKNFLKKSVLPLVHKLNLHVNSVIKIES